VTSGDPDPTFLFADLAGFTALTETHGDERAVDLADEFCDAIRRRLPDGAAEEVKTLGDAMMIKVATAADAVCLGLAIVEETRELPHFPEVRVGMHTGPAIERAKDWFGATVNIAARVAGAAQGDEVLLTDATRSAAGEPDGVEFESRGAANLRNVREPDRPAEKRPVDPVCRMIVGAEHAAGRLRHADRDYYFCSLECVRAFAADPTRYVDDSA
jgi:adenylate cyclase